MMKLYLLLLLIIGSIEFAEAKTFKVDGIRYCVLGNGTDVAVGAKTLQFNQDMIVYRRDAIIIPETVTKKNKTYQVKSIGNYAFRSSTARFITIANSVTSISSNAFLNCDELITITMPYVLAESKFRIGKYQYQSYHSNFIYKYGLNNYVKPLIEEAINKWQTKGEFESTAQWQIRVTQQTRKDKIDMLFAKYKQDFISKATKFADDDFRKQLKLSTYDADNQSYLITAGKYGDIILPVPAELAQTFKTGWSRCRKISEFVLSGDDMVLKSVTFQNGNRTFKYDGKSDVKYATSKIDYNFNPIDLGDSKTLALNNDNGIGVKRAQVEQKSITAGVADVDLNIPKTSIKNENTFVLIIANENYISEARVNFAINDGQTFKKYCELTLGVPVRNIKIVENATVGSMSTNISWLQRVLKSYGGDANAIIYYSGHGVPNEAKGDAYLLPTDITGADYQYAYSLDKLYKEMGETGAGSITYFIDACFSGAKRDGEIMVAARGVAIKAKSGVLSGNSVAFTASSGDETAFAYNEKGHGMFTYFLLKKLQESKGNVTYGELADYISTHVTRQSSIVNPKAQTPTVIPSPTLQSSWQGLKFVKY